ncbi:Fic family protein [Corynebacterium sp.]|uniref:Fic/DOC family protein n=2 Tax=Corynebacterium TaxID=1716 RepID=UPI0028AE9D9C|nr:Fic family protein [Corynebacterium sp.]
MVSDGAAAPENFYGISDPAKLERVAGRSAAQRLYELESGDPLTSFTREVLVRVHAYLMQDIYPWAGQIRTTEVGAMGMAMCRAQFVDNELDRVIRDIDRKSPSTTDIDAAVNTVADHWSEMTMVHPFQDGNSRTQRFFFDQMLRDAGWAVDWTQVNAERVHAARYVGAATVDSSYLAQTLRPAVHPADQIAAGTLTATVNTRDTRASAEIFHDMMEFKRSHPRGTPYQLPGRFNPSTTDTDLSER